MVMRSATGDGCMARAAPAPLVSMPALLTTVTAKEVIPISLKIEPRLLPLGGQAEWRKCQF